MENLYGGKNTMEGKYLLNLWQGTYSSGNGQKSIKSLIVIQRSYLYRFVSGITVKSLISSTDPKIKSFTYFLHTHFYYYLAPANYNY